MYLVYFSLYVFNGGDKYFKVLIYIQIYMTYLYKGVEGYEITD